MCVHQSATQQKWIVVPGAETGVCLCVCVCVCLYHLLKELCVRASVLRAVLSVQGGQVFQEPSTPRSPSFFPGGYSGFGLFEHTTVGDQGSKVNIHRSRFTGQGLQSTFTGQPPQVNLHRSTFRGHGSQIKVHRSTFRGLCFTTFWISGGKREQDNAVPSSTPWR